MIKTVLWDVDNTLLDFLAAERAAIKSLFTDYGLGECSDEMISRYSKINVSFWQRLERNEITKPEVLVGRFLQFFGEYGIDQRIAPEFNESYQLQGKSQAVRRFKRYGSRADEEAGQIEDRRSRGWRIPLGEARR